MKYTISAAMALAMCIPAMADRPAPSPAAAHFEVKFMTTT